VTGFHSPHGGSMGYRRRPGEHARVVRTKRAQNALFSGRTLDVLAPLHLPVKLIRGIRAAYATLRSPAPAGG
jgi:hypothetical protein